MAPSRAVLLGAVLWLLVALMLGASGALLGFRPPILLLMVASLALALVAATWALPTLRRFVREVDLRVLAGFHLVRVLGLYFVVLAARGLLPSLFVLAAGYGNLVVASLALILVLFLPPTTPRARTWWLCWNLLGLAVGLCVAIAILLVDPGAVRMLLRLPASLIPSFIAPIALATHVWMVGRLALERREVL